jgi:hypothetical protein
MNPTQRIIWTACPNGVAANGKLRISVAVGPQLSGGTELNAFPDLLDWPATAISWQATIGAQTVGATVVSAKPSSSLYQALFRPTIPVTPYVYQSRQGLNVVSPPASYLQGLFQGIYTRLAVALPKDGSVHSVGTLTGENGFGVFPKTSRELYDEIVETVKGAFPRAGGPIPVEQTHDPAFAAALTSLFLQPLAPANSGIPNKPPAFDFHQAYSLLQRHPALLRLFGFVIDLEVPRPAGLPATVGLSVAPAWTPKLGAANTTDATPVTMTTSANWLPQPRAASPLIDGGLLRLSDPDAYDVVEMDVDGTVLKTLNFVQGIVYATNMKPAADTPTAYGAPALRSAGLSLSMTSHAEAVYGNWLRSDMLNLGLPGSVTLQAEDIAQGYRVDVWDSKHARWYQLCARSGNPRSINGYGIGKPQKVVPVPAGDEGWTEPVTTSPPGQSGPVNLPETMLRWDGWSLVASRPGKHLSDTAADGLESDTGNPPPASADFQLQTDYAATPGTLPVLRFGRGYRFRARVVDLAGNSPPFDKTAPFTFTTPETTYGRLEPVASPVIVPCAPRTPGESLETLVIRSNYDISDSKVAPCERHLAPPATSVELALTHGVIDDAAGVPSQALYTTLADRDGLSYKSLSVQKKYHGKAEGAFGQNEWIYYPPGTAPVFAVPYLPDVMGCGLSLLGLPGAGTSRVIAGFGTGWPDKRAVRLVIEAGSGAPVPPPNSQADGPLVVRAPKASVTTVRLSSWFAPGQLGLLKLWQWLAGAGEATPYLEKLFLSGGHYMATPYRELTIVHAVRQPLTAPAVQVLLPTRMPGWSYIILNGTVTANPPSTQRVDVLSSYTDPFDDGTSDSGVVLLPHKARVGELPLESGDSGDVPVTNMRQDFGDTKHHSVYYSLLATTRFGEYFTSVADVALHGTTPAVVSKPGFAQGTVVVQGTGADMSRTYAEGTDFTENDSTGTIARLSSGRIPNGATVQVSYVAPPITRSSLEPGAHPPTPQGYLANVRSSARPPAIDLRYAIPAFGWQRTSSAAKQTSARIGNMLRVYLGRPWFETGAGELLGVVVGVPGSSLAPFPPELLPFVSGYGQDPVFITRPARQASVFDFTLSVYRETSLLLAEQNGGPPWVDVAGHTVSWDASRKLWYADIALNPGASYFPFVKLALVRFQPNSLQGVELSRVVQADFIQVAPNRTMQLTFPSPTVVRVVVAGPGYLGTTDPATPDSVRAYVQEATVATSDADLTWATVPSSVDGTLLSVASQTASETIWEGEVKLPSARGTKKYRVLAAEFEQHKVVRAGNLQARVSYLDAIEI